MTGLVYFKDSQLNAFLNIFCIRIGASLKGKIILPMSSIFLPLKLAHFTFKTWLPRRETYTSVHELVYRYRQTDISSNILTPRHPI